MFCAAHMQHSKEPPLSLAVWEGHQAIAAVLIKAGADVNGRGKMRAVLLADLSCWLT
jgi:hypothetical protein